MQTKNTSTGKLLSRFTKDLAPGRVKWIGLRPAKRQTMLEVDTTLALEGLGLEGDHRTSKTPGSGRQVTLISDEHIKLIADFLNTRSIEYASLRRNLVISGINLWVIRHQLVQVGEATLETTSWCHPCSRMEENIGKGAVAAMLGQGGICAKVIKSGRISVGDSITLLPSL